MPPFQGTIEPSLVNLIKPGAATPLYDEKPPAI